MTISSRTTLLTAASVFAVLALAACGGNATTASSSAPASSTATSTAGAATTGRPDFTAFRKCMAANGVTLPEPGAQGAPPSGMPTAPPSGLPAGGPPSGMPLPDGVDQATFDKAQAACASSRPQFVGAGGGQPDATAIAAFRSCLADHDVQLADAPDAMRQLDRTDPKVAAALKTCSALLPAPGTAPVPSST